MLIEHQALVNYVHAAAELYSISANDRVLQFAAVSFDAHVEEVYPCLIRGGTLVLRNEEMLNCKRFLELCDAWRLTFVTLPTVFWHELASVIEAQRLAVPSSLRILVIGGEAALSERLATWFDRVGTRVRLLNTYGPTETTVNRFWPRVWWIESRRLYANPSPWQPSSARQRSPNWHDTSNQVIETPMTCWSRSGQLAVER